MKSTKSLFLATMLAFAALSCTSNPEEQGAVTAILNQIVIEYDADGVWTGVTNANSTINYGDMTF